MAERKPWNQGGTQQIAQAECAKHCDHAVCKHCDHAVCHEGNDELWPTHAYTQLRDHMSWKYSHDVEWPSLIGQERQGTKQHRIGRPKRCKYIVRQRPDQECCLGPQIVGHTDSKWSFSI